MIKKSIQAIALACSFGSSVNAMEIESPYLYKPTYLRHAKVFHDDNGFIVLNNGNFHRVENAFVDPEVRNRTNEELGYFLGCIKDIEIEGKTQTLYRLMGQDLLIAMRNDNLIKLDDKNIDASIFQQSNYLELVQLSDGSFSLHAKMRLPGGGPGFGAICYWGFKGITHGILAVADIATGGLTAPFHAKLIIPIEVLATAVGAAATTAPTP